MSIFWDPHITGSQKIDKYYFSYVCIRRGNFFYVKQIQTLGEIIFTVHVKIMTPLQTIVEKSCFYKDIIIDILVETVIYYTKYNILLTTKTNTVENFRGKQKNYCVFL